MGIRTLSLIVILLMIAVFATLNWSAFTASTTLSVGVTEFQAPLGLLMLGLLVAVTALFAVFAIYLRTSALLEARRHTKELQAQRQLAEQAEASRYTELRAFLSSELKRLEAQDMETRATVLARTEQMEHSLRTALEEAQNTLSACLGELEDRLENGSQGLAPRPR